jgi:N-acetylmuramoyl-L-alanine amidase
MEKDIVFGTKRAGDIVMADGIANRVKHAIAAIPGGNYGSMLTRTTDTTMALPARVKKALEGHANAFISVHCNSEAGHSARGVEVWVQEGEETGGYRLAHLILDEFYRDGLSRGLPNRGVQHSIGRHIAVLHDAAPHMPAVLIETGFISNVKDAALLATGEFREAWAKAVARAVRAYYKL